jgi:multicomponent Na+:H+ antiporter subunit E
MAQTLFLALPMALLWMSLSGRFAPETFIVGYVFGVGVLTVIRLNTSFERGNGGVNVLRIPDQVLAFVIYIARLTFDVILSGIDVAWRVLSPPGRDLPIQPGVQRISTEDETNNLFISALSAHSITITPGELVIDFEEENGETVMLVHTLDQNSSDIEKLQRDQVQRLSLIRRILGL